MATGSGGRLSAPARVSSERWLTWRFFALCAALELDVFTHIAAGNTTAVSIAEAAYLDPRALTRLLDAMVAMKYLRKKGERYSLEPIARECLVKGSELYLEGMPELAKTIMFGWSQLATAVRTGKPVIAAEHGPPSQVMPLLVKSIFPVNCLCAKAVLRTMTPAQRGRIKAILDVAAGSGAWSIPFSSSIPEARVTAVDFPDIIAVTREYAARYGVADRYEYREGSIRDIEFGVARYDIVILGHIIHSEGATWGRKLIEKSAAALRDGGQLIIGEMIPNNSRTGPATALLFSLNMLLHTAEGDVFTMREYREWLKAAG
ncbi:MAG TPA: methyltransferase, partial [Candidatus Binataceae bacterium]|nr:methyltransferase [Candidatus Binataceae bacterium]